MFKIRYSSLLLLCAIITSSLQAEQPEVTPVENQKYELRSILFNKIATISVDDFNTHLLPSIKPEYCYVNGSRGYYLHYEHLLDLAHELHNNPTLYDLIVKMQQEIYAMPAQPKPKPGYGFMPSLDRYIDKQLASLSQQTGIDRALYKRALELLSTFRFDSSLNHVLAIKKIMADKTDKQVDLYVTSEKARLHEICLILKKELDTWEVTFFSYPDNDMCGYNIRTKEPNQQDNCHSLPTSTDFITPALLSQVLSKLRLYSTLG